MLPRFTLVFLLSAFVCWPAWSFPDSYDAEIKDAAADWLPGVDWRLLKAQYYQESRLEPGAVSPVGAAGVAQFMPGTWGEVSTALGYDSLSPHDAEPAITAGAYYMARMRKGWTSPRPEMDRHSLALASYNAGFGNLLRAQEYCGWPNLYNDIITCLPRVTGDHSRETITYVKRIWRYWQEMVLGL